MSKTKSEFSNGSEWQKTTNRYVGFIDIMGFKDLVARSTHEEIYVMMQQIEDAKRNNENIKWRGNEEQKVKSTFYSDSIILYSKDSSESSASVINSTLSALTNDLISSGIPHKGALAFGKMTLDNEKSIFFGQPLIDAYLLQEELIMYGIVVHSSAEAEIEKHESKASYFLFDYPCPFKGGNSHHLTIPPIFAGEESNEIDQEEQEQLMKGLKGFRHRTSGHIRKYIDNTESFLKKYNTGLK